MIDVEPDTETQFREVPLADLINDSKRPFIGMEGEIRIDAPANPPKAKH